jgi:hypothetical protein
MSAEERVLIDGVTDGGLRVRVTERGIQGFAVFLDGVPVEIQSADRLRDGGTTIIETDRGTFRDTRPQLFTTSGSVTFDGEEIRPSA